MNSNMDDHQNSLVYTNNFELHDFIHDPNFDQSIDLIHGENEDAICNFGSNLINDCFVDNNHHELLSIPPNPLIFDHNINNYGNIVHDPSSSTIGSFSCYDREVKGEGENDGGPSSATTITTTAIDGAKHRAKTDKSNILICEKRRRDRMKDKLYELRSLVPNITKMDKASIIGDAVSYVHDLQAQAWKLKDEVSGLEASLLVSENHQGSINNTINIQSYPTFKKIIQVDMFQVEERGYYAKILCNRGEGVAASLYKAIESLANFNIQNSNLATVFDNFLFTFTLNVSGSEPEMNLQNLKLLVVGALLNQGFEFMPSF
ncbi:transcription factor FER-LIKE IRON DEFICIENCY-INDUCED TRANSCRIPTION FACTOR-like [Trifolium pratense]|uniref:transcription factor FER-LIKE IRON DEFICIENCY-INDUCED TRANSCRIPTION FACTOR-like n=1 Tax=Trifolium pratense TaxID=57577 RepID=UPI001E6947A1|nr:transcription factor FER-LIKE IRON DEFICIENCY-INDUCED TRANSCRIPTION FACTOR-like [Trifolium pratense]